MRDMDVNPYDLTRAEKWLRDVLAYLAPDLLYKASVRLLLADDGAHLHISATRDRAASVVHIGPEEIVGIVQVSTTTRQAIVDKLRQVV